MTLAPRIAIALPAPATRSGALAPPQAPLPSAARRRSPAAPVAVAVCVGILVDSVVPVPLPAWLALGLAALVGWGMCWRRERLTAAAVCLLGAVLVTGAGWRHLRWSVVQPDDVSAFARETPRPVRVIGRLADQPAIVPRLSQALPAAIPQFDRSVCSLEAVSLVSGEAALPVSGTLRLDVTGQLVHAGVGDLVDVVGQISIPTGPRNPGEFDFRSYLQTAGIRTIVRCGEPEDVRVTQRAAAGWRRWQAALRTRAERLLAEQLDPATAPVGTALLLGTRTAISEELRAAFAESGTMHVLAISGANVGILAGLLWLLARLAGCGRLGTAATVLGGILGYSFLADSQPPVLRAVLMFATVMAGGPWFRVGPLVNGLAVSALGVLAWNPSHLFDTGAQLSFLAVAALIWVPSWMTFLWRQPDRGSTLADPATGWQMTGGVLRSLGRVQLTLAAIWLFTLPLTMARFHLFSPIGLVVNTLLAPLVVAVLWSGYLLLSVGLLIPAASGPFAALFDWGLQGMLWLVEHSAAIEWGHLYLPGPGDGWLAGYYVCLLAVACGLPGGTLRSWGWRGVLAWVVAGLGWGLVPRDSGELRCTFLSVGHGLSVLIELPGGRTLLYDAGQMQDGRRAQRNVQAALWERGRTRIDALVLSHPDVDHFNGVPGLARTVPIGEALVHSSFLDFTQESVRLTCDALAEHGVPIRLIRGGDRLLLDGRVAATVIQPAGDHRQSSDNANSIVLEIEYAGRKILLTGDLELQGLADLVRRPRWRGDVLLAPHHGGATANPPALAAWAGAAWIVISGGRSDPAARLEPVYAPAGTVLSTGESGAVTFVISRDGSLRCERFVEPLAGHPISR